MCTWDALYIELVENPQTNYLSLKEVVIIFEQ
jgi:hypothetical protein